MRQTLAEYLPLMKQIWTVLGMVGFLAIVVWAMWPSRKAELEALGRIPLDDDLPTPKKG